MQPSNGSTLGGVAIFIPVLTDNGDIQSNNYRYRVNLVCDDIPVLAITAILK